MLLARAALSASSEVLGQGCGVGFEDVACFLELIVIDDPLICSRFVWCEVEAVKRGFLMDCLYVHVVRVFRNRICDAQRRSVVRYFLACWYRRDVAFGKLPLQ